MVRVIEPYGAVWRHYRTHTRLQSHAEQIIPPVHLPHAHHGLQDYSAAQKSGCFAFGLPEVGACKARDIHRLAGVLPIIFDNHAGMLVCVCSYGVFVLYYYIRFAKTLPGRQRVPALAC
jgi:hypothetical protein